MNLAASIRQPALHGHRWLSVVAASALINTSYGTLSYAFSVLVTDSGPGGTFGAGTVDFSLWGKNLGDEEYVVQGVDFGALDFATQSFGAPLTAGFEVAFRY